MSHTKKDRFGSMYKPDFTIQACSYFYRVFVLILILCGVSIAQETLSYHQAIEKARAAESRYHYADALQWYQTAWQIDPSNINVLVSISKQYTGLERLDEARDTFLTILKREPKHAETHTLLAIYYEKFADDFKAALSHYQQAIDADEKGKRPRVLITQLLLQLNEIEKAKTHAESLRNFHPDSNEGYTFLGSIALKQGETNAAISYLQKAITFTKDDPEPYRLLGQALARAGKPSEAQTALHQYKNIKQSNETMSDLITKVRRESNNANNWFRLGKEYLNRKQIPKAVDAFQKGLEHAPNSAGIHAVLGALFVQGKRISQAQKHLEIAISLDPNNADNFNNLGVCYLIKRDYNNAVLALQTAIDLGEDEPGIYRNLQIAKQRMNASQ